MQAYARTSLSLVIAQLIALSTNSYAEDTPKNDENTQVEEVYVQGTALSRQKSIATKRDSMTISDAWGTDELGQLPDKNVGESLNRLPGVSMLVEKGEGRFVQIRGIQPALNNVTINGVTMGSPESDGGGRLAPLDLISGSMLGSVQVVKMPTADMDGQGIGGTVNVDVKKPFDQNEKLYGYATARYGTEELSPEGNAYGGHEPYALDALVSGKNDAQTFGWLLGGSFGSREYIAQGIYQDDWEEVDETGYFLPVEVKNNYYVIGRDRTNLSAVIEFHPSDNSQYFARAFWANWDEYQHRNRYQQALSQDIVANSADQGSSGPDRISANIRLESAEKNLFSFAAGGENNSNDLTIDYSLQLNQNSIDEPYSYWEFRSGRDFGPNTWSVSDNGIVSITADANTPDREDPNLIDFRRVRFQDRDMTEDAFILQGNVIWDLADNTFIKTGVKYTNTERDNDYNRTRYDGGDIDLTLGTDESFTNGAFINNVEAGDVPNIWMDVDAMNRFFNDSANDGYFEFNSGDTFASNYAGDYELTEDIFAAYLMGSHRIASTQVIAGLRVEQTSVDSEGYLLLADDTQDKVSVTGDYTSVLPSLIINHDFNDKLVLRSGVTRGLGRPDYDEIAPRSNYSEEVGEGFLSIGNPELEARISWNYDISLEWYANDLTLISLAVFFKDIQDEIVGRTDVYSGQTEINAVLSDLGLSGAIDSSILNTLNVSTTENSESSELMGVEFNAQTQFTSLPSPLDGLGGAFSYTIIDAEIDVERDGETISMPLPGQAESSYNFSFFYQKNTIDLALSYAYNDSFLTDINGSRNEDLDQGEFGRWDFKASWEPKEKLKLSIEALNLNNEPTTEFQGGVERRNTEYEYVGRTVFFGISYGF